jgi:hypothetical protein
MNYKIFQICFEERQLAQVDPVLTPFDNTANEMPELREYHSFLKAIENGTVNDLDAWGFFGPRWQAKLKYDAEYLISEIENNPGYDVYTFNHARIVDALFFNVWEQGEHWHPGIKDIAKKALEMSGYDSGYVDDLMFDQTTCYCSYFVASKEFWQDYMEFLKKIKFSLENLSEEDKKIYESSANYSRDQELNYFPFIVERMFSTFLIMNRDKYKVHAHTYDYSVYKDQVGNFVQILSALNNLKTLTLKHDSNEIFNQWNSIRKFILENHPQVLNLD